MIIDNDDSLLLAPPDWHTPQLTVLDSGNALTFHIQDAFNYHGYDAVGGVVLGFRLLQRAIAILSPDAPPERREFPRYSMPFFLHFASDFEIETLPSCITPDNPNHYPTPITADAYLQERLVEIGLKK